MALFMITCSTTGRKVSTGIRINGSTWNSGAEFYAYTRCPPCESYHEWCANDVTLGDEAKAADFVAASSKDQRSLEITGSFGSGGHDPWKPAALVANMTDPSVLRERSLINVRL
jgi:hypothetical protein